MAWIIKSEIIYPNKLRIGRYSTECKNRKNDKNDKNV